jgi:hypothetical protein
VINNRRVQEQIFSGQQKVDNVVLRRSNGDTATDAEVAQDVQDFRIATEFFQQRNDDLLKIKSF